MILTCYYTNKKINSDVQPDIDETQSVLTTLSDFYLKDTTDLNAPVFVIGASNLPETNYCILSSTGATAERPDKYYYFIDRITQVRKTVWELECTADALATWKSYIRQQAAFIERSSNLFDPYITDTLIPTDNSYTQRTVCSKINTDFSGTDGGAYVLSLAANGDDSGGSMIGGFRSYAMSRVAVNAVVGTLVSPTTLQALKTYFTSIADFIGGLHWIPIDYTAIGSAGVQTINIAGHSIPTLQTRIIPQNPTYTWYESFNASLTHYGDFRDNPPYRCYIAQLPFIGYVELDGARIAQANRDTSDGGVTFQLQCKIDWMSGNVVCTVSVSQVEIGQYTGNCKVDLPICAMQQNVAGIVSGAIAELGGVIQNNANSDVLSNKNDRIATAFDRGQKTNLQRHIESAGKSITQGFQGGSMSIIGGYGGSFANTTVNHRFAVIEFATNTATPPSNVAATLGRPCYRNATLSSIGGFCKTANFSVQGKMSGDEKRAINELFNTGVFLT